MVPLSGFDDGLGHPDNRLLSLTHVLGYTVGKHDMDPT
jgi:hypothetical protein